MTEHDMLYNGGRETRREIFRKKKQAKIKKTVCLTVACIGIIFFIWLLALSTKNEEVDVESTDSQETAAESAEENYIQTMLKRQQKNIKYSRVFQYVHVDENPDPIIFVEEDESVEQITEQSNKTGVPPYIKDQNSPLYLVDGVMLDQDIQEYLYAVLKEVGLEWWYPYALCQCYTESRFHYWSVSADGKDCGLWQFRKQFFAKRAAQAGLPNADIMDPYQSTYVYSRYMGGIILYNEGNIENSLKMYYGSSSDASNSKYVNYVLKWYPTLEKIR